MKLQKNLNEILATILETCKIKKLYLTSLGNSIASGYSQNRTIKPLLYRNKTLKEVMHMHSINITISHFARAQNNCDDHIFSYINNNITLGEIYEMNKNDYLNSNCSMKPTYEINLNDYSGNEDLKIRDAIFNENSIVVYNGGTGSFLDNVTRSGKHKLTYGIKKDVTSLEAILKLIQDSNRYNGTNIQVYICGAPNFLGLNISEIINVRLKRICLKYACTTYVEPIKTKFLYLPLGMENKITNYKPDIHYDEKEYEKFNNNIIRTIGDNYIFKTAMIYIDRELMKLSQEIENGNNEIVNNRIENILSNCPYIKELTKKQYDMLKKYLLEIFPYELFYIGKDKVLQYFKR